MSSPNVHPDGLSPIALSHLNKLHDELGNVIKTERATAREATISVKTYYSLGLLIGSIYEMWTRHGIGFDKVTVIPKDLLLTVSIADHPSKNRLDVEFL